MNTQQNWHWIEAYEDVYDFLAQVIVCAPDDFIYADYLPDTQQLNLERAFLELNRGVEFIISRLSLSMPLCLWNQLKMALSAYREGNVIKGAHILQEFEKQVFS